MEAHHALTIELPESLMAEGELTAAYDLLAEDSEECDVEPLFSAQSEIVTE